MKIIILSPSNNIFGGVERFCIYLKEVYASCYGNNNIEILTSTDSKFFKKIGLGPIFYSWRLSRIVKKKEFDVLITNGLLGWNINKIGKKIINIQHGTYSASAIRVDKDSNFFKYFVKRYIWGYFEKISAKKAGVVVAVSNDTSNSVKKYYKIKDVTVIPNFINYNSFEKKDKILSRKKIGLSENGKYLLFVGRFEYAKGSDILLKLAEINDWKLVVASKDFHIKNENIILFDKLNYDDMPFLYSACDVFVFPTRHEGCSLSLLEAMSCELPFFVTPVGSVSDIILVNSNFSGLVSDLENFKNNLELILKDIDSEKFQKLKKEARKIVLDYFSLDNFSKKYLSLLE